MVTAAEGRKGGRAPRVLLAPSFVSSHLLTALALGEALVRRGCAVWCFAPPEAGRSARKAGCRFVAMPLGTAYRELLRAKATPGSVAKALTALAGREARALVSLLRREQIDAVVNTPLALGAALAAEACSLPLATLGGGAALFAPGAERNVYGKLDLRRLRRELGLAATRRGSYRQAISDELVLLNWTRELHLGPPRRPASSWALSIGASNERQPRRGLPDWDGGARWSSAWSAP